MWNFPTNLRIRITIVIRIFPSCTISSVLAVEHIRNPDALALAEHVRNHLVLIWTFRLGFGVRPPSPQVHRLHIRELDSFSLNQISQI